MVWNRIDCTYFRARVWAEVQLDSISFAFSSHSLIGAQTHWRSACDVGTTPTDKISRPERYSMTILELEPWRIARLRQGLGSFCPARDRRTGKAVVSPIFRPRLNGRGNCLVPSSGQFSVREVQSHDLGYQSILEARVGCARENAQTPLSRSIVGMANSHLDHKPLLVAAEAEALTGGRNLLRPSSRFHAKPSIRSPVLWAFPSL